MTDRTLPRRIASLAFPEAQTPDEMAYNLAIHDVLRILDAHTAPDAVEREWPQGGYAPGSYWCKCVSCEQQFIGDKRAYQCPDCVIQALASLADARAAAVAMAVRDECGDIVEREGHNLHRAVRNVPIPADGQAALDRLIAEARREAFEEAADMCKTQAKPFARDFVLRRLAKQGYSMTSRVKQRMLVRLSRQLRARGSKEGQS